MASNPASLAVNPMVGGMAAIDAPATTAATATTGMDRPTPDSLRRSRVPALWSTIPTTRNRVDLNSAWEMSRASPPRAAARVPSPVRTTRKPSWLTVPYASSTLMSYWRRARQPPRVIVAAPRVRVIGRQPGVAAKTGASTATR